MAEMYFQRGSTRNVKAITEKLYGHSVSPGTISNPVKKLDSTQRAFARQRLAKPYPSVILDARREKA